MASFTSDCMDRMQSNNLVNAHSIREKRFNPTHARRVLAIDPSREFHEFYATSIHMRVVYKSRRLEAYNITRVALKSSCA